MTLAVLWYLINAVPVFYQKSPAQAVVLGIMTVVMLALNLLLIYDFFKPEKEGVLADVRAQKG
ncbi:MAG: hypothetical protein D6710_09875 [Nitrospirae bacterium]|nr:MAG: hypothetical protein D6710_09875 [Nitrospirota bacterium]